MTATITITLQDEEQSWIVETPIKTLSPATLDWLLDRLQEKLNNDEKGKQYLA
jgi:hypothetical protein